MLPIVALVAACSTTPVLQDSALASISINAAPGHFHQLEFPFRLPADGKDKTIFVGRFDRLQASPDWAPVLSVCLQGEDPSREQVCLALSASKDGRSIVPTRFESKGLKDLDPLRQPFPAIDMIQGPFKILLAQSAGKATFSLNGMVLFESRHIAQPTRFTLFCSSAVCTISMADGGA